MTNRRNRRLRHRRHKARTHNRRVIADMWNAAKQLEDHSTLLRVPLWMFRPMKELTR